LILRDDGGCGAKTTPLPFGVATVGRREPEARRDDRPGVPSTRGRFPIDRERGGDGGEVPLSSEATEAPSSFVSVSLGGGPGLLPSRGQKKENIDLVC